MRLSREITILLLAIPGSITSLVCARRFRSSENEQRDVNDRALPSLILPSAPKASSINWPSVNNDVLKDYSVHPLSQSIHWILYQIKQLADEHFVYTQTSQNQPEYHGVLYWTFKITEANAALLRERLGADAVLIETRTAARRQGEITEPDSTTVSNASLTFNTTSLTLPVNALIPQHYAPTNLKVVSWPPDKQLRSLNSYVFNNSWRLEPITYIIDNGINPENPDFQRGVDKWLYSPMIVERHQADESDMGPGYHGSCVASIAAGAFNGVCKQSKLVVIKIGLSLPLRELVWAFDAILTDIKNGGNVKPGVILFPFASFDNPDIMEWVLIKMGMTKIIAQGGTIVVPAGNYAHNARSRSEADTLPAVWADATFPLIVAGAVNNDGKHFYVSQGGRHVTAWAPGVNNPCAAGPGTRFLAIRGTSGAAAMVGGMIAQALAIGRIPFVPNRNTPIAVKDWLMNAARWPRQPGGLPVIWNEIEGY